MVQWRTVVLAFDTAVYKAKPPSSTTHPGSLTVPLTLVQDAVKHFDALVTGMLNNVGVTAGDFELVTRFYSVGSVALEYGEDGDYSAPSLDDCMRAIRRWVLSSPGDSQVTSVVADLAEADELAVVYPLPTNVPTDAKFGALGLAVPVFGRDGEPCLHFIRARVDGKPTRDQLANLLFHEWWHGVDSCLRHNFRSDVRSVVAWERSQPGSKKWTEEDLVIAPRDGAPTTRIKIYHHHDAKDVPIYETQWSPHLLFSRIRAGERPGKKDSTRPDVMIFDESEVDPLLIAVKRPRANAVAWRRPPPRRAPASSSPSVCTCTGTSTSPSSPPTTTAISSNIKLSEWGKYLGAPTVNAAQPPVAFERVLVIVGDDRLAFPQLA